MRTRLLTFVAAVGLGAALAQSASAADLSMPPIYKAPPPAYFTWTGWYLGLNGGGGWGQTSHTATFGAVGAPALTTGNFNTRAGSPAAPSATIINWDNGSSVLKPISSGPISAAPSTVPQAQRRSR